MLVTEQFLWLLVVTIVTGASLIVVLVVMVRAANGELGRNGVAGIRTSATLRSDPAWIAAHRAALPATKNALGAFLGGVLGGSVMALFFPPAMAIGVSLLLGAVVALGLVVIGCVRGHHAAVRLGDEPFAD